jgi:hypothetical protein
MKRHSRSWIAPLVSLLLAAAALTCRGLVQMDLDRIEAYALSLKGVMSRTDAFQIEKLREAGAMMATPRQDGVDEMRIPGKRAHRDRARLAREGIEIDRRIQEALIRLARGTPG